MRVNLQQHRPSGAGEDRNLDSTWAGTGIAKQHRPSGAGEDRNKVWFALVAVLGLGSTGPPGPVRIATSGAGSASRTGPCSTGPPGPVRIATRTPKPASIALRWQHRPSGAGEDRNFHDARDFARGLLQHRPSGAGEDRNSLYLKASVSTAVAAPALRGR